MSKSDKELAVDVAIAYINAIHSQRTAPAGVQQGRVSIDGCLNIIRGVYKTLSSFDDVE
ncbi:MAG: hypothetical protein GX245_00520 [Eubacteriaceae bacterium]|jgi:hypothetical protein|nr:hypothetical protein [Eubacteriaceae bacterium]